MLFKGEESPYLTPASHGCSHDEVLLLEVGVSHLKPLQLLKTAAMTGWYRLPTTTSQGAPIAGLQVIR